MKKIGQFIYPWGNGHYSRMMRLNDALNETMGDELETHFFSKSDNYNKGLSWYISNFDTTKKSMHILNLVESLTILYQCLAQIPSLSRKPFGQFNISL